MKLINKYQSGGVVATYSSPLQTPTPQPTNTSQTSGGINPDDLLSKEVIKELMLKGNPNDVNSFLNEFQQYNQTNAMFGGSNMFTRGSLYKLASKANQIISNHEFLKQAITEASSRDALQEVAVDTIGNIYVQDDKGKINTMNPDAYSKLKDREKYQVLTNDDLIRLRKYDPNFAFDTHLTSIIQNGVGADKVNQQIFDIIDKLGKTTTKETTYTDKADLAASLNNPNIKDPNTAAKQGLNQLAAAYQDMGVDGVYKIVREASERDSNTLNSAFNYIVSMLPKNSLNVLKAKASISGLEGGAKGLLQAALTMTDSRTTSLDLDYQKGLNKDGTIKSEKEGKTDEQSLLEKWLAGPYDMSHDFVLNDPENSKWSMKVLGAQTVGIPGKTANDVLQPMPLAIMLNGGVSKAMALVDRNNIYFGDKKITPIEFKNYWYDGDPTAIVYMPTKADGSIDFALLKNAQRAEDYIKTHKITDSNKMNEVYRNMGAGFYQVDAQGKQISNTQGVKPFAAIHAYTTGNSPSALNNDYDIKLSGKKNSDMVDYLKDGFKNYKMDLKTQFFGTDIYSGIMFMPINTSAAHDVHFLAGNGPRVPQQTEQSMALAPTGNFTPVYANSNALYK